MAIGSFIECIGDAAISRRAEMHTAGKNVFDRKRITYLQRATYVVEVSFRQCEARQTIDSVRLKKGQGNEFNRIGITAIQEEIICAIT